jgi:Fur family zinc uptake transcriptional regulator
MSIAPISSFRAPRHDHRRCVRDALRRAREVCVVNHARLTSTRQRVLELVWSAHQPMLAYDLLEQLRSDLPRAAPPTIYRALDFLQAHGLVHRIESLNAYIGCANPSHPHCGQFLICTQCNEVAELDDGRISAVIEARARAQGFECATQTVEIRGQCPRCVTHKP